VSWFDRWVPVRSPAPAHLADAVRAWQCLPAPDRRVPLASACFVVVDTETTGLDPYSAGLLSIGDVLRASLLEKDLQIRGLTAAEPWQFYESWGADREWKPPENR